MSWNKINRGFIIDGDTFWFVDGESFLLTHVAIDNGHIIERFRTGREYIFSEAVESKGKICFLPRFDPEILVYDKCNENIDIIKMDWVMSRNMLTRAYLQMDDCVLIFPKAVQDSFVKFHISTKEITYINEPVKASLNGRSIKDDDSLYVGVERVGRKVVLPIADTNEACIFDLDEDQIEIKKVLGDDERILNIVLLGEYFLIVLNEARYIYRCLRSNLGELGKYEKIVIEDMEIGKNSYREIIDLGDDFLLVQWMADKSVLVDKLTKEYRLVDFLGEKYRSYGGLISIKRYRDGKFIVFPSNANDVFFIWDSADMKLDCKMITGNVPWQAYYTQLVCSENENCTIEDYFRFLDVKQH